MIVTDSSALYEALLRPGPARQRLHGQRVCAPHLVDVEVASIVRKTTFKGEITAAEAIKVVRLLGTARLRRYGHTSFIERLWQLRHNLAPYDAMYVALAERLAVPLVTVDGKLARVPELPVRVDVIPMAC